MTLLACSVCRSDNTDMENVRGCDHQYQSSEDGCVVNFYEDESFQGKLLGTFKTKELIQTFDVSEDIGDEVCVRCEKSRNLFKG